MRRLLAILAVLCLCPTFGWAAGENLEEQADMLGFGALEAAAGEYSPGGVLDLDLTAELENLAQESGALLEGSVGQALRGGALLLAVVLFCALAETVGFGEGGREVNAVNLVGTLAITAIAITDVTALMGLGRETLERMEGFSTLLIPTMAAATAASGAPAAAAARQMATMFFSGGVTALMTQILMPLVYAYLALRVAYAALGNDGLARLAGTLKWGITVTLTVVLLAFVGYLTVSGVIAGATDAMAVRTTKFAVSSMVPVVGGILSDAAETVLAGAGILKNAVGVFGMLVIIGMCLAPFLRLGLHYLTYKLVGALSSTVAQGRVAGLIDSLGGAFGLLLGMTGAAAMVLLISMIASVGLVGS